jgi:GT2 family glycosyltransferase
VIERGAIAGKADQTDEKQQRAPESHPLPVTVVVVNCNGGQDTLKCLRSVAASNPAPERFVLVDNGSTDGTRDLIETSYNGPVPLSTVWLPTNVGPAEARNIGARYASSAYIAFLDNDTVVCKSWLKEALATAVAFQADCVQCKLLQGSDSSRIDSLGYLLGPCGFPRHIVRQGATDGPELQRPRLLFGVKSAAMVIGREAFAKAGGFDAFFFIYGEETDLCWRVLRSGGRIVLSPQSVVIHNAGGTRRFLPQQANTLLYRLGTRNYIRMVAKNSPPRRVFVDLAGHIAIWLGTAALQTSRGRFQRARLILQGVVDALVMLPNVMRARKESSLPYVELPNELRMRFTMQYIWRTVRAI